MMFSHSKGLVQQRGVVQALFLVKVLVIIALVAWIAHSSLQLAQMLTSEDESQANRPASPLATHRETNPNTPPKVDISALTSLPLFGEPAPIIETPQEEVLVEEEPEEELEETQLNLILRGLFTSENDKAGRAIVANGRREQLYQVGDEIQGLPQVKLLAVFDDRIKLDNRGNAEVLYLYPESERLASTSSSAPTATPALSRHQQLANKLTSQPSRFSSANNSSGVKKLNEIMRVVRERDKTTGDMLGFRVLPGRDRESFAKSGLQANDVITSIDGDALNDLRTAMTIYREKREATQVSLLILRGDSEISLDIDLAELNI